MSSIREQSRNQLGFSEDPILRSVTGNLYFSGRARGHDSGIDPPLRLFFSALIIRLVVLKSEKIGNASIGGVCRDHEGLFMLGYAECIGRATSSVAELAACKRGLELALQNGWHSLWVEGDAKMVVDVFTNEVRLKSKEDLKIAREIRVLIPQLNDFTVSHIYRQGNRVAHNFAKLGYRYQKPQIWRGIPPNEVERLLHGIHIYRCSAASISIKSPGDHRHLDAVAPRVAVAVAAAAAALPLPQGLLTTRGWAPRCGPQTCGHLPEWVNDGTLTSQVNRLRQATNDATTLADFRHSPRSGSPSAIEKEQDSGSRSRRCSQWR
ncbi:hypothetical protein B296_00051777 [Ensete ventricosum]|uniref:RNase H type-1 domain-containing protein n=1 Tax=Ensete ventricosum TaxID=4639 RepID=A0A426Y441_ENSVE|nr:hypothetical protein B296_00051777 [Ensete ventricosum]